MGTFGSTKASKAERIIGTVTVVIILIIVKAVLA